MSELTMKVTVPVLEELAARNQDFVVQLSHAAAKEIGEKYSHAILQSTIVQDALARVDLEIVAAKQEAGNLVTSKIGMWDNSRSPNKYSLRQNVVDQINVDFGDIIHQRFEKWLETQSFDKIVTDIATRFVEQKMTALMKKELGEFLRRF